MASQSASPQGHHNIVVQAMGDGITVNVSYPYLTLIPWQRRVRTQPRHDVDLLKPAYQSVAIVGRDNDLAFLLEWLQGDGIKVTAIVGRGGSGKTRLALEFLKQTPEGWDAGFLEADEAQRFKSDGNLSAWSWQKPTLIVIDYAALLGPTLSAWFKELADHPQDGPPLRILLVERHADPANGWYHDLADATWHGDEVRNLFSPLEPRHVARLEETEQRREVLRSGLAATQVFAHGAVVPHVPEPGEDFGFDQRLAHDQWADPLLLLMAAVIGFESGLPAALSLSRLDLAKRLAEREVSRLRKNTPGNAAQDILVRLYACITLCGGLDLETSVAVAEQECHALHKDYPGNAGQVVDDLARYLGAGRILPSLTPDLLAEAFLLVALGKSGTGVVTRIAPFALERVAAALIRTTQDFGHGGDTLPLEWLEALLEQGASDPAILGAIEGALPTDSVTLRPLAVRVTQALIDRLRQTTEKEKAAGFAAISLARLLNNQCVRQSYMGQRTEALASIQEAVDLYRILAQTIPDVFLSYLASSLNNQSVRQSQLGHHAEALASIQEAVSIQRTLAEGKTNIPLSDLARSLNNQSVMEGSMKQEEEALTSIQEAVNIYHTLAQADPDAFLHELATSLNTQSNTQSSMGQHAEALTSSQKAVSIRRILAQANPDAFLPGLASSLNNQSGEQSVMGYNADALASVEEAVNIYRILAQANPHAFLPNLVTSLGTLGASLEVQGRTLEARHAVTEALQVLPPFLSQAPGVFNSLAYALIRDYVRRSQNLKTELDEELLTPYLALLETGEPND